MAESSPDRRPSTRPLPLRPNMHIKCGDNGSKANLCYVTGGTLQLDGTAIRGIADETVDNVVIEGFVFTGAIGHSLWVTKPGDITFIDCEWRDFTRSKVPIMMDYFDSLGDSELVVTIQDSILRRNRFFGDESYSALIYGNSNQNRLTLERTVFSDNDMIWNNTRSETHSYLIETLGPVCMDLCCFIDNMVGAADVAVFGSNLTSYLVHDSNSTGALCPFAADFQTIQQYEQYTPNCVDATEPVCDFAISDTPSVCSL